MSVDGLGGQPSFVLPVHEEAYRFEPGAYEIDVIADVVGRCKPTKLGTIKLALSDEMAAALAQEDGVLFERKIGGEYEGHTRKK